MAQAKKENSRARPLSPRRIGMARGQMSADDAMCGYWEWFRKDGIKMRSGYFEEGEQVGEWTTSTGEARSLR